VSAGASPGVARGPLAAGERVLLLDRKGRTYLVRLTVGGAFQSHAGVVSHDEVIGREEGCEVTARRRAEARGGASGRFVVLRPTLSDVVVKMPRGAQVIYPKDLGAIVVAADLFPGVRVLEAGVGSGALSLAALRAGCEVVGYEVRPDFAARARANVADVLGDAPYRVEERDVYEGIEERDLDRVLLDLPEPWRVVGHAAAALRPGGILCAYLPTINQTAALRLELARAPFVRAETIEVLHRSWHVEGRSVRPDHRMVAHTGFITTARRALDEAPGGAEGPGDQAAPAERWPTAR